MWSHWSRRRCSLWKRSTRPIYGGGASTVQRRLFVDWPVKCIFNVSQLISQAHCQRVQEQILWLINNMESLTKQSQTHSNELIVNRTKNPLQPIKNGSQKRWQAIRRGFQGAFAFLWASLKGWNLLYSCDCRVLTRGIIMWLVFIMLS